MKAKRVSSEHIIWNRSFDFPLIFISDLQQKLNKHLSNIQHFIININTNTNTQLSECLHSDNFETVSISHEQGKIVPNYLKKK
jgi:hypothetical protein